MCGREGAKCWSRSSFEMASLVTETQLVELWFVHALGPGHALNKSVHSADKCRSCAARVAMALPRRTKWVIGLDSLVVKIQKIGTAGLRGRLLLLSGSDDDRAGSIPKALLESPLTAESRRHQNTLYMYTKTYSALPAHQSPNQIRVIIQLALARAGRAAVGERRVRARRTRGTRGRGLRARVLVRPAPVALAFARERCVVTRLARVATHCPDSGRNVACRAVGACRGIRHARIRARRTRCTTGAARIIAGWAVDERDRSLRGAHGRARVRVETKAAVGAARDAGRRRVGAARAREARTGLTRKGIVRACRTRVACRGARGLDVATARTGYARAGKWSQRERARLA
jgi:hypothetical protein